MKIIDFNKKNNSDTMKIIDFNKKQLQDNENHYF